MVLYRKYRPQNFADVLGQDHIKDPLLASLNSGKISHAYLFTGPRGTGKTSIARILAKAVNCVSPTKGDPCDKCLTCDDIREGRHLDIMEIDAASNRGIDEIRDLREKIKLSPVAGKYKVYIIDEVHMLTGEAFNALLKTLEEPPEHAIFILATTEPQKIPATISSRSTRYDFKVPSVEHIAAKLAHINKKEGWAISGDALSEISVLAGGAFRDAEVLLDKVASADTKASLVKTREILGKKEISSSIDFLRLINDGKTKESLVWFDNYVKDGGSVRVLAESVLDSLRKTLLIKTGAESVIGAITEGDLASLQKFEEEISKPEVLKLVDLFNISISDLREASIPQLPIEIAIIDATLEHDKGEDSQKIKSNNDVQNEVDERSHKPNTDRIEKVNDKENGQKTSTENVDEKDTPVSKKEEKTPSKTLKKLQEKWPQFLKEVKSTNRSVEMFLRTARPIDLDEDLLVIEFSYKFHKGKIEEKKYRDIVEEALEKFAGKHLRIKGVVSHKPPDPKVVHKRENYNEPKEEVDPVSIFGTLD